MINFQTEKSKLITHKGQIDFNHNIDEVCVVGKLLLVLLMDYTNQGTVVIRNQSLNNVYAINEECNIVWNIKEIVDEDHIYVGLDIDDLSQNQIRLTSFKGKVYILDVKNKAIVGTSFSR